MAKKDKYNFDAFDNAVKENEYDFDAFDNTLKKKDISGEDSQLDSTIGTQLESPTEDKYGFAKTLDEGRLKLKDKLIETDFPTSNIPEDKLTPIEEEEKPDPELVALLNKNREAYKMGNIENEEIPVMVAHKLGTKGAGIINVDPKELYPEAPQSIPVKGSLDYITRQGAVSSGVGGILTATGTKQTKQDYLQELEDLSKYTPTQLEEKAAFAVSMMIDIPLFAGLGSANGMLLKGAGAQIKNSFIRAGVKKATADKVVTSVVKKYANTLLNSSLKTGLTLAEYDGIKGFSDDIARGKSLDDIDFEERFKGMGKSGITGTMLGAFGANFSFLKNSLSGINSNLSRGLAKAGMVMAEIPAEAGVFSLANAVIKERPISWSNYVDDLMTVGALKVSQLPQMVAKQESKTIPFTKDEVKILGDKVQSTEYFVRNPDKIEGALNNKDIPLSAKSKILYTVTGEKSEKLDVIPDKISVTKEGVVTTKNNAGELIEKRSFSTFEEASDYSLRLQKEVDDYNMNRRVGELPVKDKAKVSDKLNDQGVEEKALTSVLTKSSNDRTPEENKLVGKFKKAIDDVYKEKEEIKSKKVEVKTEKGKEEPKIKEETKSASTEQKAEPVSKLEVRPQVGEEAPLRQPSKEPAGKEKKVKTQPAKEETLEGKKFILENKEYTFNGKKKPNGDYVAVDSKGYKIGITERALKTLNYVGEVKEQPKEAGVEEVRDLHEQRGEEVPTGRREVVKGKTTEKGIVFKDITYEKESQIKEALDKGGITKPEYEQAVNMLNSKNFNDSKEKLRSVLDSYFTKQAIGDEKPNLGEVYNTIVDFIKKAMTMYGDKIKSARDVAKYTGIKYNKTLQDAYNEAIGKKKISNDFKMRGFPKRIKEFDEFKNIKLDIEENPELKYKPQNLKDVKGKIEKMTDEEVVSAMDDLSKISEIGKGGNLSVIAAADLINRYRAEGKDIMPIIESLSEAGTTMGQLIRQYAEIKGSTPEGFLSIIEKKLAKQDRYLTDTQKQKIKDLSERDILNRAELKKQIKLVQKDFTDGNIKKYNDAKNKVEKDYTELAKYTQSIVPEKFWDMMGMVLQGNLLTPMSQITNIYANMMNIPLSFSSKSIASVMDYIYSGVSGKPRVVRTPLKQPIYGAKGFGMGVAEAAKQIKTGMSSYEKLEVARGFQPIRALVQAFSGKDMPVNRKGKIATKDRTKKIIEGILGAPAEVSFRFLNLGDKPFYRMSETGTLYELAKDKGLKGRDLQKFMMFPDTKSSEIAERAAREATFQEKSTTAKLATGTVSSISKHLGEVPAVGGVLKFALKTQMPYIKTPSNIVSQTLDFALPPVSFCKGLHYAVRGNRRDALLHMGKAAVGTMIAGAAYTLLDHGLITGSPDKDKKLRDIGYEIMPPNSINLSGLNRLIRGEDPKWRVGDDVVNFTKMGIVGMTIGVHANVDRAMKELKSKEGGLSDPTARAIATMLEIPTYALEQSFLRGTSSLIQAINDKQWDYWLTNTFNAVSSIPLPNTLAAINRANNEFIYDVKGDNIKERLGNVIRNKLFMVDNLPIRRNLWGQEIKSTPESANPWLYHLIDVTKSQKLEENPESRMIYDLYLDTEDSGVIPSTPSSTITANNQKIELSREEYESLIEKVGLIRLQKLRGLMDDDRFIKKSNEDKIKDIERIYREGYEVGKKIFLIESNFPEISESFEKWKKGNF